MNVEIMENGPKISIIIPVYNGSQYLDESINSCLSQTYKNYEIIVVNDGSQDNGMTRKTAMKYRNQIRYYEKENGGCASALNFGIKKMKGEYFAWLSHDDIFCENKLLDQINAIIMSGDMDTISIANYYLANNDLSEKQNMNFQYYYPHSMIRNSVFMLLWGEYHFSGLLFRKSHFKRIGLFDEKLKTAQDNEFIFRLLKNQKIVFSEKPVSVVRLHDASGTALCKDTVNRENCSLYYNFLSEMNEFELNSLTGNKFDVYSKIGGILIGMGDKERAEKIRREISIAGVYRHFGIQFNKLTSKKIIIFGSGQYGLRIKYELETRGINPWCFVDNSAEKKNTIIDGIPCFMPDIIKKESESILIIALKYHKQIERQLYDMGVENYLFKEEVDSILLRESNI